ncbi:MAG: MFS transporter [Anaerolineales bacterium]|jgi:MFS transporter, DHA3 family, macrolide efflux protein
MSALPKPGGMKPFFLIWLGQTISIVGSGLTGFALAVWIFQQTGRATPFALTVLFGTLPRVLLAPVAGSLADRKNRRWLMILADTGAALITLAWVFLVAGGRLEIWHIYLGAFLSSTFGAFQEPAYTASIAMLVPKKNLARANGMVQMSQAIEILAAPVLAGFLFVLIGLQGIFLLDFASFFFAAGALLMVRIPQPKAEVEDAGGKTGVWKDAILGWKYLRARPGLFWLLVYFAGVNFLMNFAMVLSGPLILSFSSPQMYGMLQMVVGVGMLAGSLLISTWGGPQRRVMGLFGFITLAGLGLGLAGLRQSELVIAAGMGLLMFNIPLGSGLSQAVFQSKVAPAVQGRVFAIRIAISRSIMPLAFLLAGPLADHIFQPLLTPAGALADTFLGTLLGVGPGRGIGLMFVISSLLLLSISVLAYSNPRIRMLEDELPDTLQEAGDLPSPAAGMAD